MKTNKCDICGTECMAGATLRYDKTLYPPNREFSSDGIKMSVVFTVVQVGYNNSRHTIDLCDECLVKVKEGLTIKGQRVESGNDD